MGALILSRASYSFDEEKNKEHRRDFPISQVRSRGEIDRKIFTDSWTGWSTSLYGKIENLVQPACMSMFSLVTQGTLFCILFTSISSQLWELARSHSLNSQHRSIYPFRNKIDDVLVTGNNVSLACKSFIANAFVSLCSLRQSISERASERATRIARFLPLFIKRCDLVPRPLLTHSTPVIISQSY